MPLFSYLIELKIKSMLATRNTDTPLRQAALPSSLLLAALRSHPSQLLPRSAAFYGNLL